MTYTTDSTVPSTSVTSVAGDGVASYFDVVNDVRSDILVSGEALMVCRWSTSDVVYSSMSNNCVVSGSTANCSVNDVASQGFNTRYVSCQDSLGNSQNTSQNLDVSFYLDYTAPTTTTDSTTQVWIPNYTVTFIEADNVDSDVITYYCRDTANSCVPSILIDNGGQIVFNSSHRGVNYLRYNSTDDAGNQQITVSETININQLSIFSSASDDAVTIAGGASVNITTVANDSDTGQEMTLWVCNSSAVNSTGCLGGEYCNATGSKNMSCIFSAESVSNTYNWYAFVFDELNEMAVLNYSGSYTVDATIPVITVNNPNNGSEITQDSVTFTITSDETLTNTWYTLDGGVNNVSMANISLYVYTHSNGSIADGNYNASFWGNDSYGNIGASQISFAINTTPADSTPPIITIYSPINGTYYTSGSLILNLSSDESLNWAGYSNNSEPFVDLDNYTTTNWNTTVSFDEGQHNLTFYVNDSAENQNNKSVVIWVDLTNPSLDDFSCSDVNDSENVVCSGNVSDVIGLNYVIVGYNATGSWQNSSQLSLSGVNDSFSYTITSGNSSPLGFVAQVYLYDLSGRGNLTESDSVVISDDTFPGMYNITYVPNTTAGLDPGVKVNVSVDVVEDYNISSVVLMYRNASVSDWTSVVMSNGSALTYLGASTVTYNASFTPGNDTWYFKINATDTVGNQNISINYTLVIQNDTSQNISTTIPTIKSFTTGQAGGNNSVGRLVINNTGEGGLNFNVSFISSDLSGRLSVNYTNNVTHTYSSIGSNTGINISIEVNTTSLDAGLYAYNISVSSNAGTILYERYVNIQSVAGPYIAVSIETYSSTVTVGQEGLELIAKVENSGTQDASNVYLNWTLPSEFTLTSGSLNRNIGNLGIGLSATNSIVVSVNSDAGNKVVNLTANGTGTGISGGDTKIVTIGSPTVVTETVVVAGSGSGGGGSDSGGASGGAVIYDIIAEVVRGEKDYFNIEVYNKYKNQELKDITVELSDFLKEDYKISPKKILNIKYNETGLFRVEMTAPTYLYYEERDLKAIIQGQLVSGNSSRTYSEIQNIKLIIQEITRVEAKDKFSEAEEAIEKMKREGFSISSVESLIKQADDWLYKERRNKKSWGVSFEIIEIKEAAFESNDLLRRLTEAMRRPRKSNLIVGNIISNVGSYDKTTPLTGLIVGESLFASKSTKDLVNLGIAAFERGDYFSALERAKEARTLLLLERKGNFFLFMYLYWYLVLFGFFVLLGGGFVSYRKYQKSAITKRIEDINNEEENLKKLFVETQRNYFAGHLTVGVYHKMMDQHQDKLAKLKKQRITLRNRRIRMLKPEQIYQELGIERLQIEAEAKKLQGEFYIDRKISESEYKPQFQILNERLAEIEGERATLEILKERKPKKIGAKFIKPKLKKAIVEAEKEIKNKGKR